MERSELVQNYIATIHKDRVDFSNKKLNLEFNMYDRNFKDLLPSDKNVSILEIGFGTGYFIKYLITNGYTNVKGIEISHEEFNFVKSNIYKNVELITDTESYLKQHENCFDIVFMHQALEHIPKENVIQILKGIRASLKKNGVFVASTPNAYNPFNQYVFGADFTHEFIYTPESLNQVHLIAGFSKVNVFRLMEENRSLHSKLTNITAFILSKTIKVLIFLNRSYMGPQNCFSKDIYCVCIK